MNATEKAHLFARQGNAEGLTALCKDDPSLINARSLFDGATMLHSAARYGNARTAYHLLTQLGANPQLKDENGHRPVDIAAHTGNPQLNALLVEATYPRVALELIQSKRGSEEKAAGFLSEAQLSDLAKFERGDTRSRNAERALRPEIER